MKFSYGLAFDTTKTNVSFSLCLFNICQILFTPTMFENFAFALNQLLQSSKFKSNYVQHSNVGFL